MNEIKCLGGEIMATGDQIKSLIRSHYAKNDEHFNSIVLQLAAHHARKGHTNLAREIKSIVENEREKKDKVFHLNQYGDLIDYQDVNQKLTDMIVSSELLARLKRIINEFHNKDKLKKFNLENRRKILLVGPPGTGKTMTSSVLATELGMPLGIIMMDKMINKYMGETSTKLRQIFDAITNFQSVYLFDEFDTIGTKRDKENEVGEMRRVVNTFLQLLEQDKSNSVIIAATNNISLLDKALFRRFDDVIFYKHPDLNQIKSLMKKKLALFADDIDFALIAKEAIGLNHSDIVKACHDSMKEAILNDSDTVNDNLILKNLKERKEIYGKG